MVGIGSTNSAGNSTGRRINTARKPCNSNAVTSWFERVATELHAKLVVDPAMRDARPGRASRRRAGYHQSTRPHWCGGRRRGRRAWLRCPWAVAGPGRASRRRAERSSRRGRLAGGPPPTGTQSSPAKRAGRPRGGRKSGGGQARRRPEHQQHHVVEMGGIEPPSNAEILRLLRAQSVKTFCLTSTFVTDT